MRSILTTRSISVGHGGTAILSAVDLQLNGGELVALIGVNGGGKSTLLRVLSGATGPIEGTVLLNERPIGDVHPRERARSIAVVLTERPRVGSLTVRDLVSIGRQPWTGSMGRSTPIDHERIANALDRTSISSLAARQIGELSDGELQRVLIARALAQDTPVLILDEPTAFLDLVNRATLMGLLKELTREEGKAVLFSTHDLQTAMEICDKLFVITGGTLWSGTPAEAKYQGVIEQAFTVEGMWFDPDRGGFRPK